MKNNLYGDLLALRLSVGGLEAYIKMTVLEDYENDTTKEKINAWFADIKRELSALIVSQN